MRACEKFTATGWISFDFLQLRKGNVFRFLDEAGDINLCLSDPDERSPPGIQVEIYRHLVTGKPVNQAEWMAE